MSKKHFFLVGYILDNDPRNIELELDQDTLTDEQAREYIRSQNPTATEQHITDVRVTEIQKPKNQSSDPGHNLQHSDL